MPERDPSKPAFDQAADRKAYEQRQMLQTVSDEARRQIADEQEKARRQRERTEREQQKRYRADIEKQKARIRDAERMAYRPAWATDRLTEKRIQELAEKEVQANNKTALEAIERKLDKSVDGILTAHAPDKKKELDAERRGMQMLAAEKRADRQATRPERDANRTAGKDRATAKTEEQVRRAREEHNQHVAARIRKAKARDARARQHDRDHGRE